VSTAEPLESERPSGPRSRKGVETQARLIEAAKHVFEENGFLDARVQDIAERAGLSHGSFYHYFDSKEQIFREVAEVLDERLSAPLSEVVLGHAPGSGPAERLRVAIRQHLEIYRDEARMMGLIEQVSRYDGHMRASRLGRHQRYGEQIALSIRQLQRRKLCDPDLDADIAATALGAMIARFAEMWLVQHFVDCTLDEAVDQLTTVFVNALGLRGGRPRPRVDAG
jgi:AcrR family transcriptional regulator